MNDNTTLILDPAAKPRSEQFNLIDLLIVIAKHKKRVIALPLILAALAAGISLLMPNVYKASTKLLPPQQQQSGAAALLSQLGGAASAMAGAAGIKNPNDLYVGMLRSRRIADSMIKKFDLMKVYDTDSAEKARKELAESTMVSAGKDGLITIDVESKDQKLVAQLANSYVDELMKLTRVLAVTEAAQRRMFYERQLEQTKNNLAAAEMTLKSSLDANGVISVDVDSRAMAETIGRLRAMISAKEIQIGSLEAFVTRTNPEYRRAEEELASLRSELSKLENGRPGAAATPPVAGTRSGLQNIKVLRDVKYHQMLYELLAKQYEVARLDEAKDASVIQVLDSAIEPERKTKPMRGVIVAMAALFGLLAAIAWAFVIESKERALEQPERAARLAQLRSHLRFK